MGQSAQFGCFQKKKKKKKKKLWEAQFGFDE